VPGARSAAVLVPLFEEAGELRVVLTRRTAHVPNHQGEVAFPGGGVEPGEEPVAAALREAHEELGIDPSAVEIIGELDHLATVSSRFVIAPFVGALAGRPELRPNPAEIERAFDVPLRELFSEEVYREEIWDLPWGEREVTFFELVGDTVWGATARILRQLLAVLAADADAS
jgi:8-oxo-dGTP pyrophosphatase MutT (NUDIX family)